jgi:hypothetical protein
MAAKKEKTAEQKLAALKRYLTKEIKKSESVLANPFLRSNLDGIDLGIHAQNIAYYTEVLKKMESL